MTRWNWSLPLLFGILVLSACGRMPGTDPATALLGDAELDGAQRIVGEKVPTRGIDLAAVRAVAGRESVVGGRLPLPEGPSRLQSAAERTVPVDTASALAYVQMRQIGRGAVRSFVWVRRTLAEGRGDYPVDTLIYAGRRHVDSVAVSVDGTLVSFIAEASDGNLEVFAYDLDGSAFGQEGSLLQLTATPTDEHDVSLSLDGHTFAWQGVAGEDLPALMVATLDGDLPDLQRTAFTFGGLEVTQPSLSGDGSTLVFVADLGPIGKGPVLFLLPSDASSNALPIYEGEVSDPSLTLTADRLLFAERDDGVDYVTLFDRENGAFVNLLVGVDAHHPYLTSDGLYFTYALAGDVRTRLVDLDDPDAAGEDVVASGDPWHNGQPMWAKAGFRLAYYGTTFLDQTFVRPDDDSGLSEAQRTLHYHTYAFEAPVDDRYEILSSQDYDGYLLLYEEAFNPRNPSARLIAVNDDSGGGYDPDADPPAVSRIVASLEAGKRYVVVTTACGGEGSGCGPSQGEFTNVITRGAPEPLPPDRLPEPDPTAFDITVRFVGDDLTDAQKAAFTTAAERWSAIISGDLSDIRPFALPENFSFPGSPAVEGTLDDVLIDVAFSEIDGPRGVLGQAGPRLLRNASADAPLTAYGVMQFDIAEFAPGGFFDDPKRYLDVIVHEMGHVIGIGTLWRTTGNTEGVLDDPPTVPPGLPNPDYDPRFTGAMATLEYRHLLEQAGRPAEASVPIANTGGPGNYNSHWRERIFGDELMTPYAAGRELLSRMTAASLGDLGYRVALDSAAIDVDYVLPPPPVPAVFEQTAPEKVVYQEGKDFLAAPDAARGEVWGRVVNVDLALGDIAGSTSGCEADDFDGFRRGAVALVRRGGCTFSQKVGHAEDAGADAVIIMNQGDGDRTGLFSPGFDPTPSVPVIVVTFDLGVELAATEGLRVHIDTGSDAVTSQRLAIPYGERLLEPVGTVTPDGRIDLERGATPLVTPPKPLR